MNGQQYSKSKLALALISLSLLAGCGVKGDPLPPLQPAEIGRGEPAFKKAMQELPPENEEEKKKKSKTGEKK